MLIQFNLEYYKKYPDVPIVTRSGYPVRIICTNLKGIRYNIVAAFEKGGDEYVHTYTTDGYFIDRTYSNELDLFFDLPMSYDEMLSVLNTETQQIETQQTETTKKKTCFLTSIYHMISRMWCKTKD